MSYPSDENYNPFCQFQPILLQLSEEAECNRWFIVRLSPAQHGVHPVAWSAWGAQLNGGEVSTLGVNHLISHFPWISSLARTIALEQQMDEN